MLDTKHKLWTRGLAVLVVLAAVACSDDKKPTEPEEVAPADPITQNFSGSLPQKGESCHFFTLSANGDISVSITDLQPLVSLTVGLALGAPSELDASGCGRFASDESARINEIFLSTNNLAGDYCVCIFDVGNIFPGQTVTYGLQVTHP